MTEPTPTPNSEQPQPEIDPLKQQMLLQQLRDQQNLGAAIAAGSLTGLAAAVLWAVISVLTNYQVGLLAIGIGFAVGWVVRKTGNGIDLSFGIVGGAISLLSCLIGNLFTQCAFLADAWGESVFDILLNLTWDMAVDLMVQSFSVFDLLFYGFAAYYGFRSSIRPLTEEEQASIRRR